MRISLEDRKRLKQYHATDPDRRGNLHARMKAVMQEASREIDCGALDSRLFEAICCLQAEVAFHEPADPPYGHRTGPVNEQIAARWG